MPVRTWNVYALPPAVGTGMEVARSGTSRRAVAASDALESDEAVVRHAQRRRPSSITVGAGRVDRAERRSGRSGTPSECHLDAATPDALTATYNALSGERQAPAVGSPSGLSSPPSPRRGVDTGDRSARDGRSPRPPRPLRQPRMGSPPTGITLTPTRLLGSIRYNCPVQAIRYPHGAFTHGDRGRTVPHPDRRTAPSRSARRSGSRCCRGSLITQTNPKPVASASAPPATPHRSQRAMRAGQEFHDRPVSRVRNPEAGRRRRRLPLDRCRPGSCRRPPRSRRSRSDRFSRRSREIPFATHTKPPPTAIPLGLFPTGIVCSQVRSRRSGSRCRRRGS